MTPESRLQKKIVDALNERRRCYAVKIHGGPHQNRGLPDIICCYDGVFIGIEVKLPGKEKTLTPIQQLKLRKIKEAGGFSGMVTDVEQAEELLEDTWD